MNDAADTVAIYSSTDEPSVMRLIALLDDWRLAATPVHYYQVYIPLPSQVLVSRADAEGRPEEIAQAIAELREEMAQPPVEDLSEE